MVQLIFACIICTRWSTNYNTTLIIWKSINFFPIFFSRKLKALKCYMTDIFRHTYFWGWNYPPPIFDFQIIPLSKNTTNRQSLSFKRVLALKSFTYVTTGWRDIPLLSICKNIAEQRHHTVTRITIYLIKCKGNVKC